MQVKFHAFEISTQRWNITTQESNLTAEADYNVSVHFLLLRTFPKVEINIFQAQYICNNWLMIYINDPIIICEK